MFSSQALVTFGYMHGRLNCFKAITHNTPIFASYGSLYSLLSSLVGILAYLSIVMHSIASPPNSYIDVLKLSTSEWGCI